MKSRTLFLFGLSLAFVACGTDKRYGSGDGDGDGLSGDDADDSDDSDDDADDDDDDLVDDDDDANSAHIRGMIIVELYYDDADGRVPVPWEEVVGESGDFPFGSIFVSAFRTGEDGRETYFDSYTVTRPTIEGDFYSLEVNPEQTDLSNVYAALDIRSDGIIATSEPLGVYPEDIIITSGTEADDVNISIMVDWGKWGPGGWGWGYGSGGGGCEDIVSISGDVSITVPYGGGNGMAMLLDTRGKGPYKYDPFTPIATPDGAEADYQMGMCAESGEYQLVAAYDTNGNGLIDPADLWGAYTTESGVNGNPINIGDANLEGYEIEVPIDDGRSSMDIVPFVRLSGTAVAESATAFSDIGEGSLYVAAMKYRMNAEFPVSAFDNAYDLIEWGPEALDGTESVDWELVVPANTVVYLWAYVDADADGMVNEEGEPVASGSADSAGALLTGEEGQSDIRLGLRAVE
jgi:hypothetical protein